MRKGTDIGEFTFQGDRDGITLGRKRIKLDLLSKKKLSF